MRTFITYVACLLLGARGDAFILPSAPVHYETTRNAISKSGISYGDFHGSIFHPVRNEYIWKENSYLAPISKKKARELAWYWNHGQMTKEKEYTNEYHRFRIDTYNPQCKIYQWRPFQWRPFSFRKTHVYALISCDQNISVTSILAHPYANEDDVAMCNSDLNQLVFFQN